MISTTGSMSLFAGLVTTVVACDSSIPAAPVVKTGVAETAPTPDGAKGGELGLSDFVRFHDPQRKKEAHHGGKSMCTSALCVSGRTR